MTPRVWLPVIVVFLVVLIFASLRLSSAPYAKRTTTGALQANPNIALGVMQRIKGPPTDEQDKDKAKEAKP